MNLGHFHSHDLADQDSAVPAEPHARFADDETDPAEAAHSKDGPDDARAETDKAGSSAQQLPSRLVDAVSLKLDNSDTDLKPPQSG